MAQKGLVVLAVLALLALALVGCAPAIQQLIGLDQGGLDRDGGVAALDSEGSDDSPEGSEAEVVPLVGKEQKAAIRELQRDEDFSELKAILASQGLKMKLGKAEAYKIISSEEGAQALGIEGSDDEAGTLVDIPFGSVGHLLQVSDGEADHTWAEIEEAKPPFTELTYIDTEVEAHFLFPKEETKQELLAELEGEPSYQALIDELHARGEEVAEVKVVFDEAAQEAHLLLKTSQAGGAEAQAVLGLRRPMIDGMYALDFPVRSFGKPDPRPEPVKPGEPKLIAGPVRVREPKELLPEPRERAKLAVMFGAGVSKAARLERGVFFHEFIRRTQLEVEAAKVWLGAEPEKRAFGRPDDPFTYKIRLKRAPWLETRLQLELLEGCDRGNWVAKGTQIVRPGQVEVKWDKVRMAWDRSLGGKTCKFRVKDLQNDRILGPFKGPWIATPEFLARQALEGYNVAMKVADYGLVIAKERTQSGLPIFLAGFRDLTLEKVRDLYNIIFTTVTSDTTFVNGIATPVSQQSLEIITSIDPADLSHWLTMLAEAEAQGRFNEVYDQLLPEGVDQVERAFLILGAQREDIRVLIKAVAKWYGTVTAAVQAQSSEDDTLWEEYQKALAVYGLLMAWLAQLTGETVVIPGGQVGVEGITVPLPPIVTQTGWLNAKVVESLAAAWLEALQFLYNNGYEGIYNFSADLYLTILHLYNHPQGSSFEKQLQQLTKLLNWSTADMQNRQDQLVGTIKVLKNAVTTGWAFLGVWVAGEYAGVEVQKEIENQVFSGLILGDQSTNPNITQIIDWVDQALNKVTSLWSDLPPFGDAPDIDIVGVVFTKPGDRSSIADAIERRFGSDSRFGRDTAIFVVWAAEDGTVWYDCIGPACAAIPEDTEEQIACELAGGCDNGVREYNDTDNPGGSQEGSQSSDGGKEEGAESGSSATIVGGPTLPLFCAGEICALES